MQLIAERQAADFRAFRERLDVMEAKADRRFEELSDVLKTHTRAIANLSDVLDRHGARFDRLEAEVQKNTAILNQHTAILNQHTAAIGRLEQASLETSSRLRAVERRIEEQGDREQSRYADLDARVTTLEAHDDE